ncbi:MAG: hypothetical protein PHO36_15270 [Parabacteroides sp.]|nr:hypothetical protein [Parabacteroides sp.]
MNMTRTKGSYTYPVIPNTKEWIELKNREQKVEVCQIHKAIVKTI